MLCQAAIRPDQRGVLKPRRLRRLLGDELACRIEVREVQHVRRVLGDLGEERCEVRVGALDRGGLRRGASLGLEVGREHIGERVAYGLSSWISADVFAWSFCTTKSVMIAAWILSLYAVRR